MPVLNSEMESTLSFLLTAIGVVLSPHLELTKSEVRSKNYAEWNIYMKASSHKILV
jgi:hypothetical protein